MGIVYNHLVIGFRNKHVPAETSIRNDFCVSHNRYYKISEGGRRRNFDKTKRGAYKYWELERCLNNEHSPIDRDTANNLHFLIGLRHEIEHQMTTRIDDILSAKFQACCLNYNDYLKEFFGARLGIEDYLSFSLQFSAINYEQKELLDEYPNLPQNIQGFIQSFDDGLSREEFESQKYAYRVLFVQKTVNRKGQADKVIEFVKSDTALAESINKEYIFIKERERKKYLPAQIVKIMNDEGYVKFRIYEHTVLWKRLDAKNPNKGYGTLVAGKHWHWYEKWIEIVRQHCRENQDHYR